MEKVGKRKHLYGMSSKFLNKNLQKTQHIHCYEQLLEKDLPNISCSKPLEAIYHLSSSKR
ncbi:hypothetical protein Hanom_Chr12g01088551 [Helianthus anomalus]